MKVKKQYYKDLNLLRLIACIAIFLYHINILKSGYLAVCVFFVLSGYLAVLSAFQKEHFSIRNYYIERIKKVYFPLVVVVFLTIFVVSFFPSIRWLNLKPEATSVLFGYNNFWQIKVSLNYFTQDIQSPFIHFWYIAILMQFELIFPFFFLLLKKIGNKFNKTIACAVPFLLGLFSFLFFYSTSLTGVKMIAYYNTFSRIFSLLFGVGLGFIHKYFGPQIVNVTRKKAHYKKFIYINLFFMVVFFVVSPANSIFEPLNMFIVSYLTCKFIDYATLNTKKRYTTTEKRIETLSKFSYEFYLCQYPIIFLFKNVPLNAFVKIVFIFLLTILIAILIKIIFEFIKQQYSKKENTFFARLKGCFVLVFFFCVAFGAYRYCVAKDYTKELKNLEQELAQNETILAQKQEEYLLKQQEENQKWEEVLSSLENNQQNLEESVKNLSVVGIGDSVMLGALPNLYEEFPNSYFDAKISRQIMEAKDILLDLKEKNRLGESIIINLGANGNCSLDCEKEILDLCQDSEVFWLTVTNEEKVNINNHLPILATQYKNLHIIDWNYLSKGHKDYFYADGIHLTETGKKAYTQTIYDYLYNVYLNKFEIRKQEILNEHEKEVKNKISFYGSTLLLNAYKNLLDVFPNARYVLDKDYQFESLKNTITKDIEEGKITHNVVLALDKNINLSRENYQELINLCNQYELYIVSTAAEIDLNSLASDNVHIVDFSKIIEDKSYYLADQEHLNASANELLTNMLKESLNQE